MKKITKYTYIIHRIFVGLILAISVTGAIINKDPSVKSIYVFNAMQAFLFLIVSFTPTILKKLHFEIPDIAYIVFVLFMSAHFVLGEIFGFFAKVSWWDSLLHTFSGFMLTFVSYAVIALMNEKNENFKLNIYFSALFAFSLTIAIGVIWEIIEFTSDSLFGSNMQRAYESIVNSTRGEPFVGQAALADTMKDLILDSIGSLCACALCIVLYKTKNIDIGSLELIKRNKPEKNTEDKNNSNEKLVAETEEDNEKEKPQETKEMSKKKTKLKPKESKEKITKS